MSASSNSAILQINVVDFVPMVNATSICCGIFVESSSTIDLKCVTLRYDQSVFV